MLSVVYFDMYKHTCTRGTDSSYPCSSRGTGGGWREFSFPWRYWTTDIFKVCIWLFSYPMLFLMFLTLVAYQACSSAVITSQHCCKNEWPRQYMQGNNEVGLFDVGIW